MNVWYGWFIEQSFDDQSIFEEYPTVKMKSEEENWKEHVVKIPEEKIDKVVNWLKEHLKPAWYAHIVRDNKILVIFKDKLFQLKLGDSFEEVAEYGRSHGIPEDQLPGASLFQLARNSGF